MASKLLSLLLVVFCTERALTNEAVDVLGKANIVLQNSIGLSIDDVHVQSQLSGHEIHLPDEQTFQQFKQRYVKLYADKTEENFRFEIFKINFIIAQVYQILEQGTATYGVTKFSDQTAEEFREKYGGFKGFGAYPKAEIANIPDIIAPDSIDWRTKGAVTPIKNQGNCGSCWAFSTTGNLEGQWFLKHGQLTSLSEQQLVDCDKIDYRCNGGYPYQAMEAIKLAGGIESEKDYPYMGMDYICNFNKSLVSATVSGYVNITANETVMATWCAANGPISIALNSAAMQAYQGGIAHPSKRSCDPRFMNHAVLIVGYGTEGATPFWIVKNSWGEDWGEEGYWRVFRGDNVCGLNQQVCSAVV